MACELKAKDPTALQDFIREHGIPHILRNDNSKMQTGTAWNDILCKYSIKAELTEPHHLQQNLAERHASRPSRRIPARSWIAREHLPKCGSSVCSTWSTFSTILLLSPSAGELPSRPALVTLPDISPLLQFTFYELVYFLDQDARFPRDRGATWMVCGHCRESWGCSHLLDSYSGRPTTGLLGGSYPPPAMNPTNRRLHPLSPRGVWSWSQRGVPKEVLNLKNPTQGERGSPTLSLGPTTLDLMSDLVGGSARFRPHPMPWVLLCPCGCTQHSTQDHGHRCRRGNRTRSFRICPRANGMGRTKHTTRSTTVASSERRWYKPLDLQHGPGPQDRKQPSPR